MFGLKTEACFDSAHFLADYHGKCENLHGHRWRVVVYIKQNQLGAEGTERDMVLDFGEFKRVVREEVAAFDHMFLVEEGTLKQTTIDALRNEGFKLKILPYRTTAENLAKNFAELFGKRCLPISQVDVYETPLNCASYFVD
ncbi:6-carboxytetrahydropterin synthase [Atopobium sp. oral taxon 810]|uniref:6-pyruvoyl trahydropterin synthase family protein n=1 Tax=Atopobium sp. oral taxon 810 TaxID=712158 RepID=UPI000397943A|nr:6-carboxytetrahydropterin synthase [Atopobium sp. oral taxon 810]ERI06236.1 6-pyruvoyl tetrahydropterin synthase/QueD family protein [Atopobium sp. oral taxon 810 str. F0209]